MQNVYTFSPCGDIFSIWGGGSLFPHGGGGVGTFGLAPITIFGGAPNCCHIFYCTDIYNFSRSWRFFRRNSVFHFSGGGPKGVGEGVEI